MFIAMDESSLNRLVVGSIPTASTTFPFIINAFSTTKRARKDRRRNRVVLFITIDTPSLVILWSYRQVKCSQHRENFTDLCRLFDRSGVIPLVTDRMKYLSHCHVSPYILLGCKPKESTHEISHLRTWPFARSSRTCGIYPRSRRAHASECCSGPALSSGRSKLPIESVNREPSAGSL